MLLSAYLVPFGVEFLANCEERGGELLHACVVVISWLQHCACSNMCQRLRLSSGALARCRAIPCRFRATTKGTALRTLLYGCIAYGKRVALVALVAILPSLLISAQQRKRRQPKSYCSSLAARLYPTRNWCCSALAAHYIHLQSTLASV